MVGVAATLVPLLVSELLLGSGTILASEPRAFFPFILGSNSPVISGKAYYVATDGDDSNPGTIDQPWKSIHRAAGVLQAGDGVLVRGGTYVLNRTEDGPILPANSGSSKDGHIVYRPYPGDEDPVIIQGDDSPPGGIIIKGKSYIAIEGFTFRGFHRGLIIQAPSHHIVIKDNVFEYNKMAGISVSGHVEGTTKNGCDYLTIEGNVVHHNGYHEDGSPATGPGEGNGSGISINHDGNPYVYSSDYSHFHSVVRGNYIYHNYDGTGGDTDGDADHLEGHGIIIDRGGNAPPTLIENNVIFDNGGKGIHLYGARNVWIIGNTLYKNCTDPLFKHWNTQAEIAVYHVTSPYYLPIKNIHVLNNIAYALGNTQITYFPHVASSELTMRDNLWYGFPYRETYSPYGLNYLRSNPQFVNGSSDPSTADFHLTGSSPAIDEGTSSLKSGSQAVDFDRITRPKGMGYDMGAYER